MPITATTPVYWRACVPSELCWACLPSVTVSLLFLACAPGRFGADCRLQCQCQNGGTCDRFSGCVCPSGWHGVHCEKSDRIPQILNVATELEFNLGTMPRINCAAAGNPFPVRGSMELRKPDGTMLLVSPGHPNLLSAPLSHQLDSSFLGSLTQGTFYRLCLLPWP